MKVYRILFKVIFVLGLCLSCEGFFKSESLQDFIEDIVDIAKFHYNGMRSLNDSTINEIWYFFKTKYHRVYSSIG